MRGQTRVGDDGAHGPAATRRRAAAGMVVLALVATWCVVGLGPAQAAPLRAALPATDFLAPRCDGPTALDPSDPATHDGPDDLLAVSGARLAAYNAGSVVPLYDAAGATADAPLCGTREVAGVGPVSQWMFCTEWASDLCGSVAEDGTMLDSSGSPVSPMAGLPHNPRLAASPDDERLIAYLVQTGHPYTGTGTRYQFGGTAVANATDSTDSRRALQALVWCASDPGSIPDPEFAQACEANLPAGERARLLALIPVTPLAQLAFDVSGSTVQVGQTATVSLTTNVFAQPMTVTSSPAGIFAVCSGEATIVGGELTVTAPTDGSTSARVELCATAAQAGPASVAVSVTPPSVRRMGWNQATSAPVADPCQIFASFDDVAQLTASSQAAATFVAPPPPPPTPSPSPSPSPTPTRTPTETPTPTPVPTSVPTSGSSSTTVSAPLPLTRPTATGGVRATVLRPVPVTATSVRPVAQVALATTGSDEGSAMLLATTAVLAGTVLVLVSRRRRREP